MTDHNTTANEFSQIVADFRTIVWHDLGRDAADAVPVNDLVESGYVGSDNATPWSDLLPDAAKALSDADSDLDEEEEEIREELLEGAKEKYNAGWLEREKEICDEADADRDEELREAHSRTIHS